MKKMNKKAKIGIISALLAVVVVASVVTILFLTGVFGGGKLGSLSSEKYEIVGIDFVKMTQKGIHTYDLNITLEERFDTTNTCRPERNRGILCDKQVYRIASGVRPRR